MEINGVRNYRHHRTTLSSRHFHNFFTLPTATTTAAATSADIDISGDELTEADIFSDSSESTHSTISRHINNNNHNLGFKSGILAALSDDDNNNNRFSTEAMTTTTTQFRSIPKPPQQRVTNEWTQSVPIRNFHQHSAPMNVPIMMKIPRKFSQLDEFPANDGGDDDEEMLPPHEIVAMKLKSTSSVLEGVGRTLKGRDLRQVRNAVWRQTGFLD